MHRLKIAACSFLLSMTFLGYGMEQSSQGSDEYDEILELFKNFAIDPLDLCTCTLKFCNQENSKEAYIIHAIEHDCTFCLMVQLKNKSWEINHQLFFGDDKKACWQTPLLYACQKGSCKVVKFLLNFNPEATLNFSSGICWSAIHFAAISDYDTDQIIELLLKNKVSVDQQTKGNIEIRELFQFNQFKKHFGLACKSGMTPLFVACFTGKIPRITKFLEKKASIMHLLDDGENIFHNFGSFLQAYSDKKITVHDEYLKIKAILNVLKSACDTIYYTEEHLALLFLQDKEYKEVIFILLLIRKRPKTLLSQLPRCVLLQSICPFIKSTSEILLEIPDCYGKTARERLNEKLDLEWHVN